MPVLKLIGDLIKEKPKVPKVPTVDVQEEQTKAIEGNLAAEPLLSRLASITDERRFGEQLRRIDALLGNDLRENLSAQIATGLKGELPQDTIDFVRRQAAQRATAGGFGGSQMGRNLELRDLGLTSLEQVNRSIDSATRWLTVASGAASMPGFADFSSMFVTPGQQIAQKNIDIERQFQRDFVSNQIDAAFSTGTAVGNFLGNMDDTIVQLASSYLGGGLGGFMGGGTGGGGGANSTQVGTGPGQIQPTYNSLGGRGAVAAGFGGFR